MNRLGKELDKCSLSSQRFKDLKIFLHGKGVFRCSSKAGMKRAIKGYCERKYEEMEG